MFYGCFLQAYLEGQEKCEQELVLLIETTAGVAEHTKRQVVNDVVNTFAGDRRLVGPDKRGTHQTG